MLKLNNILAHYGANKKTKRLGRGSGSGHGPTAGKGDKGQLARSGGSVRAGFEGGQMPLYRRIPKRGFKNVLRRTMATLNVGDLERFSGKEVTLESLREVGMVKGRHDRLNILGNGELKKAVTVKAHKVTPQALEKIQKAGGKVEMIVIPKPTTRSKKSVTKGA